MLLKNNVGQEVVDKSGNSGVISLIDELIVVNFKDKQRNFELDTFEKGFLKFKDPMLQKVVDDQIQFNRTIKPKAIINDVSVFQKPIKKERSKSMIDPDKVFDSKYHIKYLQRHPILQYFEVERLFGIKISGFGKGINPTNNSIVLISVVRKTQGSFVYHDHWTEDGDYVYSGEGKNGNQKMSNGNKAILDSKMNHKPIYLFIKFSPREYYFQGKFKLLDFTYENDKDEDGNMRKEYRFRLSKISKELDVK